MSSELKKAIENLYLVFSGYQLKPTMVSCGCCFHDEDKIHAKHLRHLENDDLANFTHSALLTWGDLDDYKHFLPRILELLARAEIGVDTFIIFNKFEYGAWRDWPGDEQQVVEDFLYAWWANLIKNKIFFDMEAFIEINKLTNNIEKLLELWTISYEDNSFYNYVDFINDYYFDLIYDSKQFKEINKDQLVIFLDWIKSNSKILEQAFYYFEKSDENLAERISTALLYIENWV